MKVRTYFFGCLLSVLMWQCAPKENEYVVIAGKGVAEDTAWMKVAEALQNKHRAALLSYREDPAELLPQLQQIHPRYVAIVEKPETLGRDYVMEMHRLSRKVDNDIYADFLWGIITGYDAAGNKKSLKKFEIEMGIHHQELGLSWDKPVPKNLWLKVAEYCDNDVFATEATFHYLKSDWTARQILADLAGMSVNDTTNTLTTRFIFGNNRKPQDQFCYRDLSKPVHELPPDVKLFLEDACPVMMSQKHGDASSLLPYFPGYKYENGVSTYREEEVGEGGYVYAEPGMYGNVALLDIASMHPHSTIAECLFP